MIGCRVSGRARPVLGETKWKPPHRRVEVSLGARALRERSTKGRREPEPTSTRPSAYPKSHRRALPGTPPTGRPAHRRSLPRKLTTPGCDKSLPSPPAPDPRHALDRTHRASRCLRLAPAGPSRPPGEKPGIRRAPKIAHPRASRAPRANRRQSPGSKPVRRPRREEASSSRAPNGYPLARPPKRKWWRCSKARSTGSGPLGRR